jgi:hypothetical protein
MTSPKCRRKTGSNRNEIGVVPVRLPAMKGRRDKNLSGKGDGFSQGQRIQMLSVNMEEYSIK